MRPTGVRILVQLSFAVLAPFSADAQISDNVVKIGVLTDLSGPAATPTGTGSGVPAQMAADDFGGSVAGKPIVIVSADHQIKPDVGSAIARRWYDIEQVAGGEARVIRYFQERMPYGLSMPDVP